MPDIHFAPAPDDKQVLEAGSDLTPRFDAHGLVTAVATDADTGDVLMLAHMNAEALALSIETGIAHYWSRSRKQLWKKGETSGNFQKIAEMRVDCDQDAVWIKVRPQGDRAACHTGRRSCFYRSVHLKEAGTAELQTDPIIES